MKNNQKGFAGIIVVVIVALGILGFGAYKYFSTQQPVCWPYCEGMTDKDREEIKQSALEAETKDWKIYKNEKYGFEFKYPNNLKSSTNEILIPPAYTEKVEAMNFLYTLPVKDCGESGLVEHCKSETTNFGLSIGMINKSFNLVAKEVGGYFGSETKSFSIEERRGISIEMGAEGRGVVYYFVAFNENKTLFLSRGFIQEGGLPGLLEVPGFINYKEQEDLFTQIISTFKFTK